jgi:hypothetical protein
MPPWHADSQYGVFANERVLNDDQIKTIVSWVDAGTPRGDPRQTPLLPEFGNGWQLGQPDVVLPMQQEFTVAPNGSDVHASFEVFAALPQDVWVAAVEVNGNPRVVRSATVFIEDPAGSPETRERLVSAIPGAMYEVFPNDSAKLLKAGSKLVLTMHYHPSTDIQRDRTSVGLILAKGPVVWQINSRALAVGRDFVFPTDCELIEMLPRGGAGTDVSYSAVYPNNREEIMLLVPKYDANWETTYELAQPKPMTKGTKLKFAASAPNAANSETIEGWFDYRVRR